MTNSTKTEGPTHIVPPTPPTPQDYYSCIGCCHYHTQRYSSAETAAGVSVHKSCHHPMMVVNKTMSLDTNENMESDDKTVTPECCPYLNEDKK